VANACPKVHETPLAQSPSGGQPMTLPQRSGVAFSDAQV